MLYFARRDIQRWGKTVLEVSTSSRLCLLLLDVEYSIFFPFQLPAKFRKIKSRKMRWEGHVARMGERRGLYRVFGGET